MDWSVRQVEDAMRIKLDFNNMMAHTLGDYGISESELNGLFTKSAIDAMKTKRGNMKWRELPYNQTDIVNDIISTADSIANGYDDFVLLGIGGSALGPIAVQQALCHMHYNLLPKSVRKRPRVFVEDNIDPERMAALLDIIDVERTMFNVITKSGSTSETMAQFLIITGLLEERLGNKDIYKHIIVTTDEHKGNLIKIALEHNIKTYYVPDGVGGRFSELSPVGLLAAAVCGIDIKALLLGAQLMDEICSSDDIWGNPAYMLAALQVAAMKKGCNISVMMPYADSLKYMADWYAQIWAESLGKRVDVNGNEVFTGQTPVKALGVTDQHSQVQLYTEGPFDKVVTFLTVENYRSSIVIPEKFNEIPDVSFLGGHTLNELISAEQHATEYALYKNKRLSHKITLPEVNAFTIGQLLYFFEIMTAFAGELLEINAFDQPGVEEGKNATYALLGRPGYDEKRAELNSRPVPENKYII